MHIVTPPSSQPDLKLIDRLTWLETSGLAFVTAIGLPVLAGWMLPALGERLPAGWSVMSRASAFCTLLAAAAILLSQPGRSARMVSASRWLGAVIGLSAAAVFLQIILNSTLSLGALIGYGQEAPGRTAPHSAAFFGLLGLSLVLLRARKDWLGHVSDVATFGAIGLVLVVLAAHVFNATDLYGPAATIRVSWHELACMLVLAGARLARRAEYGAFAVLLGSGIGSDYARFTLPFALGLPFLMDAAVHYLVLGGWLGLAAAQALAAAISSLFLLGAGVFLARRISGLERNLQAMSLVDALTQVYNLRGFQFLGEQAVREAQRARTPLTLVYVDLNNLKTINDTLGHDAGSQCIRETAGLLRDHMRSSDIVARIGGDEFAVVFHGERDEARAAVQRMRDAADAANRAGARAYTLSFSAGDAAYDAARDSFASLVARADAAMYAEKQRMKAGR